MKRHFSSLILPPLPFSAAHGAACDSGYDIQKSVWVTNRLRQNRKNSGTTSAPRLPPGTAGCRQDWKKK